MMLTEKEFRQYRALLMEIRVLQKRLMKLPKGIVHDYASDYSTGYPRAIQLEGVADPVPMQKLVYLIKVRKSEAELLLMRIEEEIGKVEDSATRVVLTAHYCEGDTFEKIAKDLGYLDEKSARAIKDRYFQNKSPESEKSDFKMVE